MEPEKQPKNDIQKVIGWTTSLKLSKLKFLICGGSSMKFALASSLQLLKPF